MENLLIYNSKTKEIIGPAGCNSLEAYTINMSTEDKQNISGIFVKNIPNDYYNYKVINNELIKMSEQEILELRQYGKILTEEERQLEKLKPTQEEIRKAEQTIEILTLIQEVI